MANNEILAQLRDIHLPPPVSAWPLAPGWYGLALLLAICLIAIVAIYYTGQKKRRMRRAALKKLRQINAQLKETTNQPPDLSALSILLKQMAIAYYPNKAIQGLNGQAWLTFLDKTHGSQAFTQGIGQVLATTPYQRNPKISNPDALCLLVKQWIKRGDRRV